MSERRDDLEERLRRVMVELIAFEAMQAGIEEFDAAVAPLLAERDDLRARLGQLEPPADADLEHAPGCLRLRPEREHIGDRANGAEVWQLWCRQCRARAVYVDGVRQEPEPLPEPEPGPRDRRDDPHMRDLIKRYLYAEDKDGAGKATRKRMGELEPVLSENGVKWRMGNPKTHTTMTELGRLAKMPPA
jgi:hypothetical protein